MWYLILVKKGLQLSQEIFWNFHIWMTQYTINPPNYVTSYFKISSYIYGEKYVPDF